MNWPARSSRGDGSLRERDADLRAIARFLAVGRVVHLQFEGAARLEPERRARGRDLHSGAGRVRRDQPLRQVLEIGAARALAPRATVGRGRVLLVRLQHRRPRDVRLRPVIDEHVVHDLAVARANLDRLHPLRLGEIRRDVEVLVLDRAVGRQLVGVRHLEDDVGLAGAPALRERRALAAGPPDRPWGRRRSPSAISVCAVGVAQQPLVVEGPGRRVGVPRRHVPVADFVADGLRPGPGLLVREKRHRRDFAGPVAAGAVLENDGRDVLAERRHVLLDRPARGLAVQRRGTHRPDP